MKNFNFDIKNKLEVATPGHNWFLYWKCSPSLWKEKLASLKPYGMIFIPINWGWHHEQANVVDFGEKSADRDLKTLARLGSELGVEVIFLLPSSGCPFNHNGGIPLFLGQSKAKNINNMDLSSLGHNGELYHQGSFFNQEVFKAYHQFMTSFAEFAQKLTSSVLVLTEYSIFEGNERVDLFQDYSTYFEDGFARYIKKQEILNNKTQDDWESDFRSEIKNLYLETAKEILANKISSELNFTILGAGTGQLFMRTFSHDRECSGYLSHALKSLELGSFPASLMLNAEERAMGVDEFLDEIYSNNYLNKKMNFSLNEEEEEGFYPFKLFSLYGFSDQCWQQWKNIGLIKILEKDFPWMALMKSQDDLEIDDSRDDQLYFFGGDLTETTFHKMINLFLSGVNIFLDVSLIDPELNRKLEMFILENDLAVEQVKFIAPIKKASLQASAFFIFSSDDLLNESEKDQNKFWRKVLETINIQHLDTIKKDDHIFPFWQKRTGNPYELNYQDVRRLHLFNPTEKKKTALIGHHKNFAFLKCAKEIKSKISSTKAGLEIDIGPYGHLALDYGHFEDKGL